MARIIRREVRRRRRGYTLFTVALVIVVLLGAVDVITLQTKIAKLKTGVGGLGQLAIGVAGQNRVMEQLTFWGAIAAVLGVLVLLTRGERVLIEEEAEAEPEAQPPPVPLRKPARQLVRRA